MTIVTLSMLQHENILGTFLVPKSPKNTRSLLFTSIMDAIKPDQISWSITQPIIKESEDEAKERRL